jgi:hypothetical protein
VEIREHKASLAISAWRGFLFATLSSFWICNPVVEIREHKASLAISAWRGFLFATLS